MDTSVILAQLRGKWGPSGSHLRPFVGAWYGMVRHPRKSWIFLEDFFPGTPPEWAPPPGGVHKKNPPHNMGFGRLNPTNFYRIFSPRDTARRILSR